jgi:uncharacterized membrane protein YsdA (DUF1294 family)/cold shock CspA family protein
MIENYYGKIKIWNNEKGYGFIALENHEKDIFVHISSFVNKNNRPAINQEVTFNISHNNKGKKEAQNVKLLSYKLTPEQEKLTYGYKDKSIYSVNIMAKFIVFAFMLLLLFYYTNQKIQIEILIVYLITGLTTYFVYGMDKSKALNDEYRVSENFLHLLSLFGGWTGAIIAQQRFRHKTNKMPFQIIFIITIIANAYFLFSYLII